MVSVLRKTVITVFFIMGISFINTLIMGFVSYNWPSGKASKALMEHTCIFIELALQAIRTLHQIFW
jgi:hypothetical protein